MQHNGPDNEIHNEVTHSDGASYTIIFKAPES
jgi:hypothetical protein